MEVPYREGIMPYFVAKIVQYPVHSHCSSVFTMK